MELNQTNETMQSITDKALKDLDMAKKILKSYGYYIESLWEVDDIIEQYVCTKQEAMTILDMALNNVEVIENTWTSIQRIAESMNIKRR